MANCNKHSKVTETVKKKANFSGGGGVPRVPGQACELAYISEVSYLPIWGHGANIYE